MDFREVTKLFSDKDFDGEPIQIKEIKENEELPVEKSEFSEIELQKRG